ncbi:MAG: alpha/beta hydrolase domain-containing protein [Chloroflexi bacterium]|nr:alpha/beta hydrolase domain-containing protein [Chloroflexota bacterium]
MAVTHFDVTNRRPLADGREFGDVGQYEEVRGILHFAVDPDHEANTRITDIDLAPRNSDGLVEFAADLHVMRPADPAKGRRRIVYDVLNRGNKVMLGQFNSAVNAAPVAGVDAPTEVGNGFLMRHGYTAVWCGWSPDAPRLAGRMKLYAPEAIDRGMPLTGRIFSQFQPMTRVRHLRLADRFHTPHPAADTLEMNALLTIRDQPDLEPRLIPRDRWKFALEDHGEPVEDAGFIYMADGFEPGKMYQLTYTTIGAPIVGLGYLSMRDAVSFLKYGSADDGNPSAGEIDHAIAFGVSQSARYLRHYVYMDLNRDEQGRDVFEGVLPHVGGGMRGEFNQRFGQPSKDLPSVIAQMFPFTAAPSTDPVSEESGGVLDRMSERGAGTKVFFTNTGAEYWRGDASLIHTDPTGQNDVEDHPSTRSYHFSATMHGPGIWPPTDTQAIDGMRGQNLLNSVDYTPFMRALLVRLDEWISDGTAPPPSKHPRVDDGSAVPAASLARAFEGIPVKFPAHIPVPRRLDFGVDPTRDRTLNLPPSSGEAYGSLVSDVDDDGNEIGGITHPDVSVPLATSTPWNLRHPDVGAPDQIIGLTGGPRGSTLPFARTAAERESTGDRRPSIAERYSSRDHYLQLVKEKAVALVADRYMLEEDVERVVEQAGVRWDWFTNGRGE